MNRKTAAIMIIALLNILFTAIPVQSPPDNPRGVGGYIFRSDGTTQAPINTSYLINDTTNSFFIKSRTSNPAAGFTGRYFETINGSNKDNLLLYAWNATMYGITASVLKTTTDNVNITINKTRKPEINVTITYPPNNTAFAVGAKNLSARFNVLGANATNCNATITTSDENIINVTGTRVLYLGSIKRLENAYTYWNITALGQGTATLTVTASCANESKYLEAVRQRKIVASVQDTVKPAVFLVSPANNSVYTLPNTVFHYNVSDTSSIRNCTLIINNKINRTNSTPVQKNKKMNFTVSLANGIYKWSVNCTDLAKNTGSSATFNLSVRISALKFENQAATSPIELISGSTKQVSCNATVVHSTSVTQITRVNATLYHTTSTSNSPNDNNNHYSDSDCRSIKNTSNRMNVSCEMTMQYYANSGTWTCNITAFDSIGKNSTGIATTVEELYAISTDPSINYGTAAPGALSQEKNLTLYNYGNKDINVSILGYAKQEDDNLSMNCRYGGNITVTNQRYSTGKGQAFNTMANLTAKAAQISRLVLSQRRNDAGYTNDTNTTYWKLAVPLGLKGSCNGTIIIGAVPS